MEQCVHGRGSKLPFSDAQGTQCRSDQRGEGNVVNADDFHVLRDGEVELAAGAQDAGRCQIVESEDGRDFRMVLKEEPRRAIPAFTVRNAVDNQIVA